MGEIVNPVREIFALHQRFQFVTVNERKRLKKPQLYQRASDVLPTLKRLFLEPRLQPMRLHLSQQSRKLLCKETFPQGRQGYDLFIEFVDSLIADNPKCGYENWFAQVEGGQPAAQTNFLERFRRLPTGSQAEFLGFFGFWIDRCLGPEEDHFDEFLRTESEPKVEDEAKRKVAEFVDELIANRGKRWVEEQLQKSLLSNNLFRLPHQTGTDELREDEWLLICCAIRDEVRQGNLLDPGAGLDGEEYPSIRCAVAYRCAREIYPSKLRGANTWDLLQYVDRQRKKWRPDSPGAKGSDDELPKQDQKGFRKTAPRGGHDWKGPLTGSQKELCDWIIGKRSNSSEALQNELRRRPHELWSIKKSRTSVEIWFLDPQEYARANQKRIASNPPS